MTKQEVERTGWLLPHKYFSPVMSTLVATPSVQEELHVWVFLVEKLVISISDFQLQLKNTKWAMFWYMLNGRVDSLGTDSAARKVGKKSEVFVSAVKSRETSTTDLISISSCSPHRT